MTTEERLALREKQLAQCTRAMLEASCRLEDLVANDNGIDVTVTEALRIARRLRNVRAGNIMADNDEWKS